MTDSNEDLSRPRPKEILALLPIGILEGILVGAMMNAINGWLSPTYFRVIFPHWPGNYDSEIWLLSIKQGLLEGLVFGFLASVILIVTIGIISKLRCPLRLASRVQLKVIAFSLLFWFVGGFNAVLIAFFWPQFFDNFVGLPPGKIQGLGFAWVGGSIYGVYFGSILSTVGVLISFKRKWHQFEIRCFSLIAGRKRANHSNLSTESHP